MENDEISTILRKENLNNEELLIKSREIERIMRLKVPSGSLKKVCFHSFHFISSLLLF